MTVNDTRALTGPRRIAQFGLAATAALALVVLSVGTASALPPLDAVDDVASPLDTDGTVSVSLLANDIGQDGLAADCSGTPGNNCQFDPASVDPTGQQGANGLLVIDPVSGEAEYTTTIDPQVDPSGYAALLASAPACSGVLDTFQYILIGSLEGDIVEPASSDTATVSVASGTALRQIDAVDDMAATNVGVAVAGNVLVNDCDQTNTTPASPDNVTAALSTPPTNGTAVVNPDGATIYTPKAGFVGTDTFTYTIVTIDAGQPRTDSATVTVTVAARPVVTPRRRSYQRSAATTSCRSAWLARRYCCLVPRSSCSDAAVGHISASPSDRRAVAPFAQVAEGFCCPEVWPARGTHLSAVPDAG